MLPILRTHSWAKGRPAGLVAAAVAVVALAASLAGGCAGEEKAPKPVRPKTVPSGVAPEPGPGTAVAEGPDGEPGPGAPDGGEPGAGAGPGTDGAANGNGQLLGNGTGPGPNGSGTPSRRMDYWLERFRDYMTEEEVARYLSTPEERRFEDFGQRLLDYQRREGLIEPHKERLKRERPELLKEYYRLASYAEARAFVERHFGPGAAGAGPRGS